VAQDIFEGSDLLIKSQVTSEHEQPPAATVDLLFIKNGQDDKPIARQDGIALVGGKFEHNYKVPDVAPDEANYTLRVIAVHGAEKQTRSDVADVVVWPRTLAIHTFTETHPNEPKVPLVVVQSDTEGEKPITGSDGKASCKLALKAPYQIKALSPYSIVTDECEPGKLRSHKLKVERNIVAMFVSPDVLQAPYVANDASAPSGGHRQFVNLDSAQGGKDAMGHEVAFVVCANPKVDGRIDDRIYVQVSFSRDSKRSDPKTELLAAGVSDLKNAPDPAVYSGWVKLGADGGTAQFKVNLGLAGGDTCTVAIGGRKDQFTDASITLVNWRKLYYELRYPAMLVGKLSAAKDFADDLRGHVAVRLGKAFIEFEMFKTHEFPDADATPAKGNGMVVPAAYLGEPGGGDRYMVASGILKNIGGKFSGDAAKKNRCVYVSLCNRAFSSYTTPHTLAPLITSIDFEMPSPGNYLFEQSTKDGAINLKVAGYRWEAVVASAHLQPTTLAFEPPALAADLGAGRIKVVESQRPGQTLDLAFAAKDAGFETALSAAESAKIDAFVTGLLADPVALRTARNQVKLLVSAGSLDADVQVRAATVLAALQAKFAALAHSVDSHPGKDEHGVARGGPMDLAWLSFKDYQRIRIQLPKSPDGTAEHLKVLPGDFVGPTETASQCKVQVKFDCSSTGEINGSLAAGQMIMVLRDATAAAVSSTVCHELAHAMGMTVVPGLKNDLVPPGLTLKHIDNGGTAYVNGDAPYSLTDGKRGQFHKGGHCATGVPNPATVDLGGWSPSLAANGCILYGEGGNTDTRPAFCPTCLDLLKARRLADIRTAWDPIKRGAGQG